jgi:ComF family protein
LINSIKEQIQKVYNFIITIILPSVCPNCRRESVTPHLLCADCWNAITFIQKPLCNCCGTPLAFAADQLMCVPCLANPPVFDSGRSVFTYSGLGRDLVLRFKHSDATHLSRCLAPFLKSVGQEFFQSADYIMPVPLHRWRLFKRQYNQATLLARAVSSLVDRPVLTNCLIRKKATQSQGHKTIKERKKNVKQAFEVINPDIIKGKTVVLIDDVWTTGATIEACTKTLKKSGANRVFVLTLARVVKEF